MFDERDRVKDNPDGIVNFWDPCYFGYTLGEVADPVKAAEAMKAGRGLGLIAVGRRRV